MKIQIHPPGSSRRRTTIKFSTLLTSVLLLVCVTGIVFAAGSAASVLISRNEDIPSEEGNNYSYLSSITYTGRYVAFDSKASNLDQDIADSSSSWDIFIADRGVPDGEGKFADANIGIRLVTIQTDPNGNSRYPMMPRKPGLDATTEGRYVVFQSDASFFDKSNWYPPSEQWDPGPNRDIFLYDAVDDFIFPVSYPYEYRLGEFSNADSGSPGHISISLGNPVHAGAVVYLDGSNKPWVVFESLATNLVPGGTTSGRQHIYLRNIMEWENPNISGITTLLSKSESGFEANADSTHPVVSSDGRFVAFISYATNLVTSPQPDGTKTQVYLLDRDYDEDGTYDDTVHFYLVSSSETNLVGNGDSFTPSIGEFDNNGDDVYDTIRVAFSSDAYNLTAVDSNGYRDVFVAEIIPGTPGHTIERASLSSGGEQGNNLSTAPTISGDGAIVAFTSYATNLIFNDDNFNCYDITGIINCPDVFSRDLENHTTWRTSLTTIGDEAEANSGATQLDGNGRYASFVTFARLIGDGAHGPYQQIFVRDHGNPPGNPIISPTYWKFTGVQPDETRTRDFTISFIDMLEIGDITMDPGLDIVHFRVIPETNTCSGFTFDNGDSCTFTVEYNTNGEALGSIHYGNVIISLPSDTREELYVGVEGRVSVVTYNPLVMSD